MKKPILDGQPYQHSALRHGVCLSGSGRNVALEERTYQLLEIFREIEDWQARLSEEQFCTLVREAILACGFLDEIDAWEALTNAVERSQAMDREYEYLDVPNTPEA